MKVALIPGSYDPITLGHLDVICRTAQIFDRVIVAVMDNDAAKYGAAQTCKQYLFTRQERVDLVRVACQSLERVQVLSGSGLLIHLFEETGADCIVKGVRNQTDFLFEQKQAYWNREHDLRAETLYMPSDAKWAELSSTCVRNRLYNGDSVAELVPSAILPLLSEYVYRHGGAQNNKGHL